MSGIAALAVPTSEGAEEDAPYSIRTWQTEDGLPQNSVVGITQTPDGYLWLGTHGGLVRFDGMQFTTFNTGNSPGLGSDRIYVIDSDKSGNIWVGAEGGLTQFRVGNFTRFTTREGLANDEITSLCIDSEGAVWAAGNVGLDRVHRGKVTNIRSELLRDGIREVTSDRLGKVWVLGLKGGLYKVENGQLNLFGGSGLEAPLLRGFFLDQQSNYWAGVVFKGLVRWKQEGSTLFEKGVEVPDADVVTRGIAQQSAGTLWFSFPPAGLAYLTEDKFHFLGTQHGLPTVQVRSLFVDREDNVWLGTANNGLVRIRQKWVQNYNERQGLPFYLGRAICEPEPGRILLVNEHQGLFELEHGRFAKLSGGGGGSLWTITLRKNGELLGGKYPNGVARLPDSLSTETQLELPGEGHVQALLEDSSGTLWIATETGVLSYSQGEIASVTRTAGIRGDFSALAEHEGAVWAGGSSGGLRRFRDGTMKSYSSQDGLRSESVRYLAVDEDGALWVGTDRGLSRFRDEKFETVGLPQGLEDEGINQIVDDGLGYLWIGCNTGIYRLRKRDIEACFLDEARSLHPLRVGKQEGLISLECRKGSYPTCLRAKDGKLYFLTLKSLAMIDPARIPSAGVPPPVVVQSVVVDGEAVIHPGGFREGAEVEIEPGALRIECHFAGLSLSAPESVRYRYQLAGFERDWVEGGTRRFASYTHVPPGNYIFKVQAANSEGIWTENGASLGLIIMPQVWQTLWFKLLLAGAVAGAGFIVYRQRIAELERRRLAQEAFSRELIASQEAERKRIAGELHDSLSQDLQLIRNRAQMALNFMSPPEQIAEQLKEISTASGKAIAETRSISYALRPPELEHFGISRAVESMVEKVTGAARLEAAMEIESIDGVLKPEMEINLFRILQEALNNVIRHAEASQVIVSIKKQDRGVEISVFDNGKGFSGNDEQQRSSLGLSGMKERARILGGTLDIQSALGKGTRLTIVLPTN